MNCDQATLLISARIDGDPTGDQSAALDAHLAECQACRMVLSDWQLQDAVLMRAFLPRQEAADAVADRVSQAICCGTGVPPLSLGPEHRRDARATNLCRDSHGAGFKPPTFGLFSASKRLAHIAGWAAAAAAGFLVAMLVMKLANARPGRGAIGPQRVVAQTLVPPQTNVPVQPVAHLTLATGDVFTCPSTETTWRPISPSAPIELLAGVRTADAKCELRLPDGSCLRLNSGTEARFTGSRSVAVSAGELWSAIPRDAAPLCVSAGRTCVTSGDGGSEQGTCFNLARTADAATVTVQRGLAQVLGNGPPTTVRGGQVLRAPPPPAACVCLAAPDPWLASRWQDELLVLKPGDDPEVAARVDQLLAHIVADRGTSESPGDSEQDVRARGQAWCPPMACYIRAQPSGETRRTAARLLADLAPPSRIPDLIGLLADADGQVRYPAAIALRRLTGQTLGYAPDRFAATRDAAAVTAWREWREQNKLRYPAGK